MKAALANTLWLAACAPEWRRFRAALTGVAATQTALLQHYLRTNAATVYGQQFEFASLTTVADYQRRVPLTTYDDYVSHIQRMGEGTTNELCAAGVKLFEPSSGSTAACKLIPYTAPLQAEFLRGLAPWIFDLYAHHPRMLGGPAYWALSPLTDGARTTPGGLPIGFEDDSAYLGPLGSLLSRAAFALPAIVKLIGDMAAFRYVTLLSLLHQRDLRLISVWNPTFLTLLLAPLTEWWQALVRDVRHGTVTPPGPLSPMVSRVLARWWSPNPGRASELQTLGPAVADLWPHLRLISCWADGPSAAYLPPLRHMFPAVTFQGKGLLATEAFVSFPLMNLEGAVLAVRCHFFEFLPTAGGDPLLAHQIQRGQTYGVVVTTGGGLYRYQLRDVVEVVGHTGQAPRLRFMGKTDHISDHFGEKLDERFVSEVLAQACRGLNLTPSFMLLAPDDAASGFRYALYMEGVSPALCEPLAKAVEDGLQRNFHYAYCRKLEQLSPVRVQPVGPRAAEAYLHACVARGQKLGNIKPSVLQKTTGWDAWLPVDKPQQR